MTCGIYKITENETGRCYIGQSKNVEKRWKQHHKRFSPNLFSYEVIMECDFEQLSFWEIAWIASERSIEFGFNISVGGNTWAIKNPEEASRKKSQRLKGRILSEETCRKMSETRTGNKLSEETRHKIRMKALEREAKKRTQ